MEEIRILDLKESILADNDADADRLREELAAEIEVGKLLRTIDYDYPQFHLTMHCFLCRLKGNVTLLEHEAAKWLTPSELSSVRWLPADIELIEELKS